VSVTLYAHEGDEVTSGTVHDDGTVTGDSDVTELLQGHRGGPAAAVAALNGTFNGYVFFTTRPGEPSWVTEQPAEAAKAWASAWRPHVAKVGAEGYVHGWVCVRPPCGRGESLTLRPEGNNPYGRRAYGVVHNTTGERIGTVAKWNSGGGERPWNATLAKRGPDGLDMPLSRSYATRKEALEALSRFSNLQGMLHDATADDKKMGDRDFMGHLAWLNSFALEDDRPNAATQIQLMAEGIPAFIRNGTLTVREAEDLHMRLGDLHAAMTGKELRPLNMFALRNAHFEHERGVEAEAGWNTAAAAMADHVAKSLSSDIRYKRSVTQDALSGKAIATMGWDGTMHVRRDLADEFAVKHAPDDHVENPDSILVMLHELTHATGSDVSPEAVHRDALAYQEKNKAALEEGFTELSTVHHLGEFVEATGMWDRKTWLSQDKTMRAWANSIDNPDMIRGGADIHYPKETAAAQRWTERIAYQEGLSGEEAVARQRELADEVAREGTSTKHEVMARQLARAYQQPADPLVNTRVANAIAAAWSPLSERPEVDALHAGREVLLPS